MAVRFIIGRAGSGKTYHCLDAIRERLRQDAVDGPRLILLVPEQAALQMERAVQAPSGNPQSAMALAGAHRAEILSFRRLAFRVMEQVGGPVRQALTEPARAMVLRHLVARCGPELRYYRSGRASHTSGGFVDRLQATIAELIEEAIEPDHLMIADPSGIGGDPMPTAGDPAQAAKLYDLRLIYAAYLDYLNKGRLDPSQYLDTARRCLSRCDWLHGAELWVDGFASLSGQETLILIELVRLCSQTEITAMFDPTMYASSESSPAAEGTEGLFGKTFQTYGDLHASLVQAGLEVGDPLLLNPIPPPRFQGHAALAELERRLVHGESVESPDATIPPMDVELVELPSRRVEVDYAVARLLQWVQDPARHYRYRDIALIVRDLEPYHDLLSEALTARDIPFFIDRRRPVAHHPLVELLRSIAALATERLSLESVRIALKTGLMPITTEAADELENYLIAHGLSGFETWREGDWTFRVLSSFDKTEGGPSDVELAELERVNAARRSFLDHVDSWLRFASDPEGHTGREWTTAIHRLVEQWSVGRTIGTWADEAQRDGELDQAEEHRQVWRDTMSFLDDLAYAFVDVTLTARELTDVLEAGLCHLTLGLVPPMIDQVLVGSIERSRHPDLKGVVILGFNDGVFPQRLAEDSILNDDDRSLLKAAGVRVGAPARDRVLDESLLAYVALTRAAEALVVTYAATDSEGKSLLPSPYVSSFLAACPGLKRTVVEDPARQRATWDILNTSDLSRRLVMEFRSRPSIQRDDRTVRARWNGLYDVVRGDSTHFGRAGRVLSALDKQNEARLSPQKVEQLFAGPLRASVSQLETYAACPYQYFARYALRLRERREAAVAPVDVGTVHHAVLEDFVRTLSERGHGFAQLPEEELLGALQESCTRVSARLPPSGAVSDARSSYVLRRSASQLARIIRAQRQVSQSGRSRPKAAELSFGFDQQGSLPALELSTPNGRRVLLRGYIDRVDLVEHSDELLGIVIDYKLGRKKHLQLDQVYHGLSLQLLSYLLVLGASGRTLAGRPIRPVGALYVSLGSQYQKVDHPGRVSERDGALAGCARPRGLIRFDRFDALDSSTDAGRSEHYNVWRTQDGNFGYPDQSDAADGESFDAALAHTRRKLGELADGILDGDISVRPYRLGTFSPCSWCRMNSVCRFEMGRFEMGLSNVRFLESLKRSEVFARLIGQGSEGE